MNVSRPEASATVEAPPVAGQSVSRSTASPLDSSIPVDGEGDGRAKAVPGDQVNYDQLYRAHHARVLRLCRLLLSDADEAADVTQEVFLKLFRATRGATARWRGVPGSAKSRSTPAATAVAPAGGSGARTAAEEFDAAALPGHALTPEQEALGRRHGGRCGRVSRAVSATTGGLCPPADRRMVDEEVARTLGLSSGSIKRHLYRAVHHMRRTLRGHL